MHVILGRHPEITSNRIRHAINFTHPILLSDDWIKIFIEFMGIRVSSMKGLTSVLNSSRESFNKSVSKVPKARIDLARPTAKPYLLTLAN
jgi:hypothetical protein